MPLNEASSGVRKRETEVGEYIPLVLRPLPEFHFVNSGGPIKFDAFGDSETDCQVRRIFFESANFNRIVSMRELGPAFEKDINAVLREASITLKVFNSRRNVEAYTNDLKTFRLPDGHFLKLRQNDSILHPEIIASEKSSVQTVIEKALGTQLLAVETVIISIRSTAYRAHWSASPSRLLEACPNARILVWHQFTSPLDTAELCACLENPQKRRTIVLLGLNDTDDAWASLANLFHLCETVVDQSGNRLTTHNDVHMAAGIGATGSRMGWGLRIQESSENPVLVLAFTQRIYTAEAGAL